jgi:hypothetical protein
MYADKTTYADITIVPLKFTNIPYSELVKNINSARAFKLYNLCSMIADENDVSKITDAILREGVEELIHQAKDIQALKDIPLEKNKIILAALACTHSVVKSCFGDTHFLDKNVNADLATQTIVIYCVIRLIGAENFYKFAEEINLHDQASQLSAMKTK